MNQPPMAHKIDTRKKYTKEVDTNIRETFQRERERLAALKQAYTPNVRQIRSK